MCETEREKVRSEFQGFLARIAVKFCTSFVLKWCVWKYENRWRSGGGGRVGEKGRENGKGVGGGLWKGGKLDGI